MNDDFEFLICDVAILWRRLVSVRSKELGISNLERRIMLQAKRHPGATQVEIANLIDVEPQNLIQPLDKLIHHGWIEKRSDVKDRRVKRIFLTPEAKSIMTKINAIGDQIRPGILNKISKPDLEKLTTQLTEMKINLEAFLEVGD